MSGIASHTDRLDAEISQLAIDIRRLSPDSSHSVPFGILFDDDSVQQYYEALVGTLKAAKRRGVVTFKGQMLLKGAHDDVIISLIQPGDNANDNNMTEKKPKPQNAPHTPPPPVPSEPKPKPHKPTQQEATPKSTGSTADSGAESTAASSEPAPVSPPAHSRSPTEFM